jgi:hypothetical protein
MAIDSSCETPDQGVMKILGALERPGVLAARTASVAVP